MKLKWLIGLLFISSFIGYLEWSGGNKLFLFQGEWEILTKLVSSPLSVLHPFTVMPMLGQILLLISLFQPHPKKWMIYVAIASIGILLLLMFAIGIMSSNYKIIVFSMPFLIFSVATMMEIRKKQT